MTSAEQVAQRLMAARRLDRCAREFLPHHETHNVRVSEDRQLAFCPACKLLWSVQGEDSMVDEVEALT